MHGLEEVPMTYMLCRNRVEDFAQWKSVFDSHLKAHQDKGLRLDNLLRCIDEPNNVFFLFEVSSLEKAQRFISDPEAIKAGEVSGVIDGEIYFVEDTEDY